MSLCEQSVHSILISTCLQGIEHQIYNSIEMVIHYRLLNKLWPFCCCCFWYDFRVIVKLLRKNSFHFFFHFNIWTDNLKWCVCVYVYDLGLAVKPPLSSAWFQTISFICLVFLWLVCSLHFDHFPVSQTMSE